MVFWQVIQASEYRISQFFVKRLCLETHGIQMGVMAPTTDCFFLSQPDQAAAVTLPAQGIIDPQDANVEPTPVGITQQSAKHSAITTTQKDVQWEEALIRGKAAVEVFQALFNYVNVIRFRRGFQHYANIR